MVSFVVEKKQIKILSIAKVWSIDLFTCTTGIMDLIQGFRELKKLQNMKEGGCLLKPGLQIVSFRVAL